MSNKDRMLQLNERLNPGSKNKVNEYAYEVIKGKGNAVSAHKAAVDAMIKKYGGKVTKEETPLFFRISGGKRSFTVRTTDRGQPESMVVFND